jgi:hypothetical protein
MDLPTHPEREDDPQRAPTSPTGRGTWVVVILVALLLAAMLLLHLSGIVGPGAH